MSEKTTTYSGGIYSVAFSPDAKTIVSGLSDKTLKVWDAPELELKEVCRSPDHIFYLDTEIRRDRAGFHTTLYDKREELARLGLMG